MEDKILEIIMAAIPAKEMGIVKTVFQERETFKIDLEKSRERILELSEYLATANKELTALRTTKDENNLKSAELAKKERSLLEREIKLDTTIAVNEAKVIRECFDKVMKVPMIRKNIYKNISKSSGSGYGNDSESGNEEVTEE